MFNIFKITTLFKKVALAALVLAVGLAAFPIIGVSAAASKGISTPPTNQIRINTPLETLWAREQAVYKHEGNRLAKANDFITKAQSMINKADEKGWDTSAVQAALNAFSAAIPAAQAAHDNGAAIIAGHAGFGVNGKVTDRTTAIATVKSLAQVLKDTRTAMNGTGKTLREAIKAFRDAHPKAGAPTP
jgi:predicted component of type VI protein secretion system